jgi:type IV secretory pathway TraG/TraD family ATPase VirD4
MGLLSWLLKRKKRAIEWQTLGDAHFADEEEIRSAGLLTDEGIRLGTYSANGTYSGKKIFAPFAKYLSFKTGFFGYREKVLRYNGDAHLITVAPTRSGKGRDILIPALLEYPGSCIVIDPKGQLAAVTQAQRERMGQKVIVLNPFNLLSDEIGKTAQYNPMAVLDPKSKAFGADCLKLAEAIVLHGREADSHWTDSARGLVAGVIGHLAATGRDDERNLAMVREIIAGPDDVLVAFAKEAMKAGNAFNSQKLARFANEKAQNWGELASILSNARTQTDFIGIETIADNLKRSDFRFRSLKKEATTVYLVLPGEYLDTCGKWFRLIVASALHELWRGSKGTLPVLAILDEFAQLGRLTVIENAMAMAAGYGLQLWPILQDLTQLKKHYGESWETFLSGAEVQQFFGPRDQTTADYISKRSGVRTVVTYGESAGTVGNSAGQSQQPLLYAHSASSLGSSESIIFGPRNVTIQAFRRPYFQIVDLWKRASLDPYHRGRSWTRLYSSSIYCGYPSPITSDWIKRTGSDGFPIMQHVPTEMDFHIIYERELVADGGANLIDSCQVLIEEEIGGISGFAATQLADTAIIAFLNSTGISLDQVRSHHLKIETSKTGYKAIFLDNQLADNPFPAYRPHEWEGTVWEALHKPSKWVFRIGVSIKADRPKGSSGSAFEDYDYIFATVQTTGDPLPNETVENLQRAALVRNCSSYRRAFHRFEGISREDLWHRPYQPSEWDLTLDRTGSDPWKDSRLSHHPTGMEFEVCKGGRYVRSITEVEDEHAWHELSHIARIAFFDRMEIHGVGIWPKSRPPEERVYAVVCGYEYRDEFYIPYDPSEWLLTDAGKSGWPWMLHAPTGLEFAIVFDREEVEKPEHDGRVTLDEYRACIVGPSTDTVPQQLYGMGNTAIVAFLEQTGKTPRLYDHESPVHSTTMRLK